MARSESNVGSKTSLTVELMPDANECSWLVSITPPGFPNGDATTQLQPYDQQLITFRKLVEDYLLHCSDPELRLELASFLQSVAEEIRMVVLYSDSALDD